MMQMPTVLNPAPDAGHILHERALALAKPPEPVVAPSEMLELLEFQLAWEHYAVETRSVTEVNPLRDLTPVPGTPPFLLGIVNLRGRITPVIDLKKFFDLPDHGLADLHHIIVVRGHGLELGLLANAIVGVRSLARVTLQAAPPTLTGIRRDYVMGITLERLIVLDLNAILADPKLVVDQDIDS